MKNITLEWKEIDQMLRISDHKNVNKRKNPLTPAKLETKKQDKKIKDLWEGSGGGDPIDRLRRATWEKLLIFDKSYLLNYLFSQSLP